MIYWLVSVANGINPFTYSKDRLTDGQHATIDPGNLPAVKWLTCTGLDIILQCSTVRKYRCSKPQCRSTHLKRVLNYLLDNCQGNRLYCRESMVYSATDATNWFAHRVGGGGKVSAWGTWQHAVTPIQQDEQSVITLDLLCQTDKSP